MVLRTKLLVTLAPLLVILVALGLGAVSLFSRLAREVDASVMQNYLSVTSLQSMELEMLRGRAVVVGAVQGQPAGGWEDEMARHNAAFVHHLRIQLKSIGSSEEELMTGELGRLHGRLSVTVMELAKLRGREEREEAYEREIGPVLDRLDELLRALRESNHQGMLSTNRDAQLAANQASLLMAVGIVVALILSGGMVFGLARSILSPIQGLTSATRELAEGKLIAPVVVRSGDELGVLADAFNVMAKQLEEYRHHTSEAIVRLHQTMESMLASFPDPIFVLDRGGRVELRNPAAAELSGELGCGEGLPEAVAPLARRVLDTGESYLAHDFKSVVALGIGGVEQYLLPRVVAMHGTGGQLVGVTIVLYDITRLRLLDDMKTNLIGTVGHELKSPLTGTRMSLHLLLEGTAGALSEMQRDLVATARDDSERLVRLLDDLLDLARLESGKLALRREACTLEQLVRRSVAPITDRLAAAEISLKEEVEGGSATLLVDIQRMSYALGNLLSNALKHSPSGAEILIRARTLPGGSIRISVIDRGPGVPLEHRKRIFERFFRVPGQPHSGAGLGLWIAREIVRAHGGRVGLAVGEPTEFYMEFPPAETGGLTEN